MMVPDGHRRRSFSLQQVDCGRRISSAFVAHQPPFCDDQRYMCFCGKMHVEGFALIAQTMGTVALFVLLAIEWRKGDDALEQHEKEKEDTTLYYISIGAIALGVQTIVSAWFESLIFRAWKYLKSAREWEREHPVVQLPKSSLTVPASPPPRYSDAGLCGKWDNDPN